MSFKLVKRKSDYGEHDVRYSKGGIGNRRHVMNPLAFNDEKSDDHIHIIGDDP